MGSFLFLFLLLGYFGFDCDGVVGVGGSASPFDASSLEAKESETCGWRLPRLLPVTRVNASHASTPHQPN